jgi:hypothetical protein
MNQNENSGLKVQIKSANPSNDLIGIALLKVKIIPFTNVILTKIYMRDPTVKIHRPTD